MGADAPRAGRRATVLVVEDDPDIGELVGDCLAAEGFAVVRARNGRQALELLASADPDVVLLDMMMPELDGFGFLSQFTRMPEPRPPVVAMSAFDGYLRAAPSRGARAVLAKPFSIEALITTVESLVEGRAPQLAPPSAIQACDEAARLLSVLALKLDEPAPTRAMDLFVDRVAAIFEVPVCLVSIITEDRQFWHASCGLSPDLQLARGSPRDESFCTHAVAAHAALVVQDARENPIFATNPFVVRRNFRFYAGVPLTDRFGQALGTLCLLDYHPRVFTTFDLELLSILARRVVAEIEWRARWSIPAAPPAAFRHLTWLDEELDVLGREAFVQALTAAALRATERRSDLCLALVAVPPDDVGRAVSELKRAFPRGLLGRLGQSRIGIVAFDEHAETVRRRAEDVSGPGSTFQVVDVPRIAGGVEQFLAAAEGALGRAGLAMPT